MIHGATNERNNVVMFFGEQPTDIDSQIDPWQSPETPQLLGIPSIALDDVSTDAIKDLVCSDCWGCNEACRSENAPILSGGWLWFLASV